jgi:hypothetical protein
MTILNEWVLEALLRRGIKVNADGTVDVCFFGDKVQHVKDIAAATRQQQHIVDQQKEEQEENKQIGLLMRQFHDIVVVMAKMTVKEFTQEKLDSYLRQLEKILETMSRKKADLRKDGYERLTKVYKMLQRSNIPAANMSSQAALSRMRRRWLVNEKVIDKSLARLEALKQLKN